MFHAPKRKKKTILVRVCVCVCWAVKMSLADFKLLKKKADFFFSIFKSFFFCHQKILNFFLLQFKLQKIFFGHLETRKNAE